MQLDIKKSFLSPFSEEKWYLKLIFPLIVAALGMVSNKTLHIDKSIVLIVSLLSFIPSVILTGFFFQFQHNEIHDQLPLLPILKTNIKKYLSYGILGIGIVLIYTIVAVLISGLLGFTLWNISKIVALILLGILLILFAILISFAQGTFADTFSFESAMNFNYILKLIAKAKGEIFIYMLISTALILGLSAINTVLGLFKYALILSPIFTVFLQLITMNLQAQVYKLAKSRLENPIL